MARAKATPEEPILSEEELAALAQEQAPVVEETPVVEEAPANWAGHPTRAYRSFEWKAPECRPDYVPPVVQPEAQADGEQEEPQV
jgi:hypothetical protein